jgi:two-component system, NtrC family, response regulator GlrR
MTVEERQTVGSTPKKLASDLVRQFRIVGLDGPAAGQTWASKGDRCSIGSHPSNDVVLDDSTVSRFHCEIRVDERGIRLRDLDSMNGTIVDGTQILDCLLRGGAVIRIGRTSVRFELAAAQNRVLISDSQQFGRLTGRSVAMRATFALLERAAATDVTMLLQGETGTGKQVAAEAIHERSARASSRLVTVDCGNLSMNLLESELFGHEKGAFTGATNQRIGAFEDASGGTLFLDEIGEMSLDLQPKLLRALEERAVRRLGSNHYVPIDVRVIAATNRDLRAEVNSGRFREDLYFRLAVVKIEMPPLRQRREDIPDLVRGLLAQLRVPPEVAARLQTDEMLAHLQRGAWVGNVRELRNYLERCIVFENPPPLNEPAPEAEPRKIRGDASVPWQLARERALAEFERAYLEDLMRRNDNVVAHAARAAGLDRVYLHKLLRRHNLRDR